MTNQGWRTLWVLSNVDNIEIERYALVGEVCDDGEVFIHKNRVGNSICTIGDTVSMKTFLMLTQDCRSLWYEDMFEE